MARPDDRSAFKKHSYRHGTPNSAFKNSSVRVGRGSFSGRVDLITLLVTLDRDFLPVIVQIAGRTCRTIHRGSVARPSARHFTVVGDDNSITNPPAMSRNLIGLTRTTIPKTPVVVPIPLFTYQTSANRRCLLHGPSNLMRQQHFFRSSSPSRLTLMSF
jgi:hypothetical protein